MASRATSHVTAFRMLANTQHGMTVAQVRLLYLTTILPVLTFGSPMWYDPWGPRSLFLPLQQVALNLISSILPMRQQLDKLNGLAATCLLTLPSNHPVSHCLAANHSAHPPNFSLLNPNIPVHYGNSAVDVLECELPDCTVQLHPWLQPPWVSAHPWRDCVSITIPPPTKEGSEDYLHTFFYPLLHSSIPSPEALWVFTDGSQVDTLALALHN
ncbi:uncharacterized protein LAESUDRAFT_764848 [Laetiporus sulphureus 93-53]|uniref:Uncharacterized protein n=1 Tax=Laetiporus sulphureus 93-53 TaxID=1314785 RepID=A0A165B3I9_9APHY|nr:uncharacterized protein LAESUDRAFT_764848 [Laetiporus sulphureus 93-53]KZT00156.1 hypothetical protein LAESUDRAFT_764848 [Laetiporus sulphureus 93-53]